MAEEVEAFLVAYSSQERPNSAPEFRNCALGGLSEERFEFAENLLDRVEIRRIRWQIERGRTHSLDRVRHTGYLMSRKVVHDDDVTVVERWSQTLFDLSHEDRPVHRPIDHERCDHPVVAQSDNQGDGLPMAVGNGPDQSFAPRATAPKSHQAGAGGGLVDEHQSGGIKQTLLANPAPPCPRHVRPFLLRRAQAFFDVDIMSLEKSPDRSTTAWNSLLAHRHNDLVQGQIRLLGYQSQQPFHVPLPAATCSRRSALLWRFLCHTS